MNEEKGKIWYKSKTIIANSLFALFSLFLEISKEFAPMLLSNLPFFKELGNSYYLIALIALAIFNIVNRKYTTEPLRKGKKKNV